MIFSEKISLSSFFQHHTLYELPPSHDFRMVMLKEIQGDDVGEDVFTVASSQFVAYRTAHVGDGPAAANLQYCS